MLGPQSESPAGMAPRFAHPPISAQDIRDLQAGAKFLYLYGSARYSDILPGTPEHITRFCWQMVASGDPFIFDPAINPQGLTWSNIHQSRGNCADAECTLQGLA